MTTETTPTTAAPETTVAPIATPAAPANAAPMAQPEAPKPGAKVELTSDELKRRLDETRTKSAAEARADLLKSLGVTDEAALKSAVAEAKRLADEKLSDIEKRDKRIGELEPKAQRADALEAALKRQVEAASSTLSDTQREAVKRLAGDDPLKQLDAIEVLRGAIPAAPIAPAAALPQTPPPAAPAIQQPVTTAAPPAPPANGTSNPTVDHVAVWKAYEKVHPIAAAQYRLQHAAAIEAALRTGG